MSRQDIFKLYENCSVQPTIEVMTNAFKIVLPNMNATDTANEDTPAITGNGSCVSTCFSELAIYFLANTHHNVTEEMFLKRNALLKAR